MLNPALAIRPHSRSLPVALFTCAVLGLSGCNWTALVSIDSAGVPAKGNSDAVSISQDGRYVAFTNDAFNMVPGGGDTHMHVYLRDTLAGSTTQIDVDNAGASSYGAQEPAISADGRFVAFTSNTQLVPGDTDSYNDVYLRDTLNGTTTLVSQFNITITLPYGESSPAISADGRFVAYTSPGFIFVQGNVQLVKAIYLRDTVNNTTTIVSVDNAGKFTSGDSYSPSLTADGRFVVFSSDGGGLVPDDTNGQADVFLRDIVSATTTRISVNSAGNQANLSSLFPVITPDGRFVAYYSNASNLVPGDTNGRYDIFLRDMVAGTVTRVSLDSAGSESNNHSFAPEVSADGRYVAFRSLATNLVDDDTNGYDDIFVRDTLTGTTSRVSVDTQGNQADYHSYDLSISADGRYAAFESWASNLVAGDSGYRDIFIKAIPQLTVTSIVPDSLPRGSTTAVTVTGTNFLAGATPIGLNTSNVVIVDENTITMNVTVPADASVGAADVSIALPGTGPGQLAGAVGTCAGCVTIPPGC